MDDEDIEQLRRTGQQLVDALRDQFADGQAEALYSLQTAAAQLRSHLVAIERLTHDLAERTSRQVSRALERQLAHTHAALGEQLANEVDMSTADLREAAREHAHAVAAQLSATGEHLTSLYDGAVTRTEDARQGLEWVAQQGAEQLTQAARALAEARIGLEDAVTAAGVAVRDQIAAATEDALRRLRDGADELLAELRGHKPAAPEPTTKPRRRSAPLRRNPDDPT
jgi:hypothetical protein